MQSLWPENLDIKINNAPTSIMYEQAKLLGLRTKNLVEADVGTGSPHNGNFTHNFYIVAPTLNNYHFLLFTVEHGIEIYPLTIYVDEVLGKELDIKPEVVDPMKMIAQIGRSMSISPHKTEAVRHFIVLSSEEEFTDNLEKILGSQRSQQVIGSLLSLMNTSYEQALS